MTMTYSEYKALPQGRYNDFPTISTDPRIQRMGGTMLSHGQGQYLDVPFITEVATNLWQGGCQDGLVLPVEIKHMLSLYVSESYTVEHKLRTRHEVQMYDASDQSMAQVDRWARWVNARRKTGPVLVHCQAGLNRSGLIVARALMMEDAEYYTADEAIEELRSKRSPLVLCNTDFEEYLRSL